MRATRPIPILAMLFVLLMATHPGVEAADVATSEKASDLSPPLVYERDIRPIFRAYCFDCHGATDVREGSLDLRLVRLLEKGGDSGPAIVKESPEASLLLERVRAGEMPPGEHRVPDEQIEILSRWIAAGAPTARPEPASIGPGLGVTPEERDYWAFRPIARPAVPSLLDAARVRTPIDAFLLVELEQQGGSFAPDADRRTLIRRAYLDLLGLPPTPAEVDAFVADPNPQAWEVVIDRLLESPHYGERWGRHWLDVAGYADSEGVTTQDTPRPWSYKYRDWVIQALNRDMPIDEFIVWQLAGDELVDRPIQQLSSDDVERLTATGYLRMAADGTATQNTEEARNQVVADTIKIVSSSLLGLSVGCAQCHDHRYDPISHEDYHRLRAVFEPVLDYRQWKTPPQRHVSLLTDQERATSQEIEAQAQEKAKERAAKQEEFMEIALQKELMGLEEPTRGQVEAAYRTPADKRTDEQNALLALHPNIGRFSPGVLYQYNQEHADELKKYDAEIAAIRAKKPREEFLRSLCEPAATGEVPVTHLFYRGDYRQPQQPVPPGGLTVAAPAESPLQIAENDPALPTTGRRLAYARWLTSGRHPLVARVLVNRFWLHHFGQALAATPDEFGKLGATPTHPELLDWLADEFMAKGWSLKHLHRQIMTSTVYRQQSTAKGELATHDRTNRLYGRFPLRRLEAEVVRDTQLYVSGRLDTKQFGPAAAVAPDETGQVVAQGEKQRRSVYLEVRRTQPVALLASFDAPVMEVNCAIRPNSAAATQSLMLMNSDFILESAKAFATRIEAEAPDVASDELLAGYDIALPEGAESEDPNATVRLRQIIAAWLLAYGRPPETEEADLAAEFLSEQETLLAARENENSRLQALTNLCQSLLGSNEFLHIQ